MPERALPFQYAEENTSTGMTSLLGLPAYVDMAEVSGLVESVRTHMIMKEGGQDWVEGPAEPRYNQACFLPWMLIGFI